MVRAGKGGFRARHSRRPGVLWARAVGEGGTGGEGGRQGKGGREDTSGRRGKEGLGAAFRYRCADGALGALVPGDAGSHAVPARQCRGLSSGAGTCGWGKDMTEGRGRWWQRGGLW